MSATLTTTETTAYVLRWHRRPGGAEFDVCPACTLRQELPVNHGTRPANTAEEARRAVVEELGGEDYYCPECGSTAENWGEPIPVNVAVVVEHLRCRIF